MNYEIEVLVNEKQHDLLWERFGRMHEVSDRLFGGGPACCVFYLDVDGQVRPMLVPYEQKNGEHLPMFPSTVVPNTDVISGMLPKLTPSERADVLRVLRHLRAKKPSDNVALYRVLHPPRRAKKKGKRRA